MKGCDCSPIGMDWFSYFVLCVFCGFCSTYFFVSNLTGVSNWVLFWRVFVSSFLVSVCVGLLFLVTAGFGNLLRGVVVDGVKRKW